MNTPTYYVYTAEWARDMPFECELRTKSEKEANDLYWSYTDSEEKRVLLYAWDDEADTYWLDTHPEEF